MCGIAGFVGIGTRQDIVRMNECIAHRGPDAEGFWEDKKKKIFFAHKRLSILDIEGGLQPMWSLNNEFVIIFNGEIYNHLEIREELIKKGHIFKTNHSDTETLLIGYKEWGQAVTEKLNGMWAFAVYDTKKNELFLSRDRFGKKPLYYSYQNKTFAFSSELKSLVCHSNILDSINVKSLKKYFAYGFIPAPNSLYNNIYKLPGGYNLVLNLDDFSFQVKKYWEFILEPYENIPENPEEEWGGKIRDLIFKAVKRRLISDVPLGVFLSGGIDSSSITAYASKCGKDKINTFCIKFQDDSFDEADFASDAARYYNTIHHCEALSLEKTKNIVPEIIEKLDEPMGDVSLVPTYLLCRLARKFVTVVLGGDGADELFAGYDPFHALKYSELYQKFIPKPIHKGIRMTMAKLPVSSKYMSLDFKIKRALCGLSYDKKLWNPIWLGPLEPSELNELFQEPLDIESTYSEAIDCWDSCTPKNIIDKTLQFYTKLYLQDDILMKIDRAGMMHGLEVRSPYLDIDLVNFVRKIPAHYKYRYGQTKYILKKALKGIVLNDIIYRKKHGFGMPIGKWFKKKRLSWQKINIPHYLNESFFLQQHKNHIQGKQDNRLFLWNYWILGKVRN